MLWVFFFFFLSALHYHFSGPSNKNIELCELQWLAEEVLSQQLVSELMSGPTRLSLQKLEEHIQPFTLVKGQAARHGAARVHP